MSNERDTWWLVERRGCQLWATGRGSFHSLTNDATRAERFASKFDAEEEIRCAEDHFRDELVATEHKFIGAVDPEGTNAQLLANALSRAEKAEVDLRDEILHSSRMRERAEAAESESSRLRGEVERLMKALEDIYRVGDGYNEHRPEDGKYAGTTGEGHARCREIAHRARTALEGRKDG